MSFLIDSFKNTETEINGRWWKAKPILNNTIRTKIKWMLEVLRGKAIAVHFKEDEMKERYVSEYRLFRYTGKDRKLRKKAKK